MNLLIIVFMVTTFVLMTTAPRSEQEIEKISVQQHQSHVISQPSSNQSNKSNENSHQDANT